MPKKVKTKKQKLLSDLRHKNISPTLEQTDFTTYSLPAPKKADSKYTHPEKAYAAPSRGVSTAGFSYLLPDLRKTILLTISIVVAEILIKYFLKI